MLISFKCLLWKELEILLRSVRFFQLEHGWCDAKMKRAADELGLDPPLFTHLALERRAKGSGGLMTDE